MRNDFILISHAVIEISNLCQDLEDFGKKRSTGAINEEELNSLVNRLCEMEQSIIPKVDQIVNFSKKEDLHENEDTWRGLLQKGRIIPTIKWLESKGLDYSDYLKYSQEAEYERNW